MKILVKEIRKKPMDIETMLPASDIGLNSKDFECLTPLDLKAHVENFGETIVAQVSVGLEFYCQCSRCLEKKASHYKSQYHFDYAVDAATEFIDVGDDLRQELILNVPAWNLCRQDCRGLCPGCGVNLNQEQCRCLSRWG